MTSSPQLVLTHGTTDLQILLMDDNGKRWRAVPEKDFVRCFHEWLLDHPEDAVVIDLPPEVTHRSNEANFIDCTDDIFTFCVNGEKITASPCRDGQGRLQLMLPKIEPALNQWFKNHALPDKQTAIDRSSFASALQKAGIKQPLLQSVLVLSTDRATDKQEPVATFIFLKKWLVAQGISEETITEEVFLHTGEKLESGDNPIDPRIAERIEKAVRDFYNRDQKSTLLVATMGGMPQIKPLIAEIAALLAGNQTQNLFKTEEGIMGLLPTTPVDTLRTRRLCLEQIRKGALLDAAAIAAPFRDDNEARRWVNSLKEAARLINGNPINSTEIKLPALKTIILHAQKAACWLVAIRVETALLDKRWLDAINGTITFMDAAFHDALNIWAKDNLEKYSPRDRYMRFKAVPPKFLLQGKALEEWEPWQKIKNPLKYKANTVGEAPLNTWGQMLRCQPLNDLRKTIYASPNKLADYRNANAHGVMSQAEIDEAIKRFMGANLWSQGVENPESRPKPGTCFIGCAQISQVIAHFTGETPPGVLYQRLLNALEENLIDPTPLLP